MLKVRFWSRIPSILSLNSSSMPRSSTFSFRTRFRSCPASTSQARRCLILASTSASQLLLSLAFCSLSHWDCAVSTSSRSSQTCTISLRSRSCFSAVFTFSASFSRIKLSTCSLSLRRIRRVSASPSLSEMRSSSEEASSWMSFRRLSSEACRAVIWLRSDSVSTWPAASIPSRLSRTNCSAFSRSFLQRSVASSASLASSIWNCSAISCLSSLISRLWVSCSLPTNWFFRSAHSARSSSNFAHSSSTIRVCCAFSRAPSSAHSRYDRENSSCSFRSRSLRAILLSLSACSRSWAASCCSCSVSSLASSRLTVRLAMTCLSPSASLRLPSLAASQSRASSSHSRAFTCSSARALRRVSPSSTWQRLIRSFCTRSSASLRLRSSFSAASRSLCWRMMSTLCSRSSIWRCWREVRFWAERSWWVGGAWWGEKGCGAGEGQFRDSQFSFRRQRETYGFPFIVINYITGYPATSTYSPPPLRPPASLFAYFQTSPRRDDQSEFIRIEYAFWRNMRAGRSTIIIMSLKKTETVSLEEAEVWGTLTPLVGTQPLPTYSLTQSEVLIGRNPECVICINDKRLSGKHCTLARQGDKYTLTDLSTNGTFLNDKKVGKGVTLDLAHLSEIWLLTASKVPVKETIGFKLELTATAKEASRIKEESEVRLKEEEARKKDEQAKTKLQQEEKSKEEQAKKEAEQKVKREQQAKKKESSNNFAKSIKDQITCSFCYEIMSIPVAVQPCNHRFCGGCLTELVNSKKDTCIQCRKEITTAVRDAAFTSIIDDYLKTHPDEKRDPKEEEDLKAKNIFGFDPINVRERIHGKPAVEKKKAEKVVPARRGRARQSVRASSDLSASDDDERDKCRQCVVERSGFRCSATQVHVGCHTCGKLIAQRDDPALRQCCAICSTYFCNLYYPPCKPGTKLQLLQDRRESCKIDPALLRGNDTEFEIIRNYLLGKKMNSKDVFDHMVEVAAKGKFSYLMDKKIMRVPPLVPKEVKLGKESPICDLCWNDLWFQMVFAYRTEVTPQLPSAVRDRPVCYWGINCRTMDHNKDHARKYSHCIYQTRFS